MRARRGGQRRQLQDNVPASYALYMFDPAQQTCPDRRGAAGRLHVRRPRSRCSRAPMPQRGRRRPRSTPALARAEQGADRSAQRLRHRRPAAHGRNRAERRRPGRRLPARHRDDRAGRSRWTRATGGRPGQDEGPGRPGLRLRAGALRARHPRGGAAASTMGLRSAIGETEFEQVQILGYAPVEPDGSFKLHGAGRHAAGAVDHRRQGAQPADPLELDPGAPGRTPHLRRLPQPAPRCVAELRRGGQRHAGRCVNALWSQRQSGETMASMRTRVCTRNGNPMGDTATC